MPPEIMTLIRSAPARICWRTPLRKPTAPSHSREPDELCPCPPVQDSGMPAVKMRGPTTWPAVIAWRRAKSTCFFSPTQRMVVIPARTVCAAAPAMWKDSCGRSIWRTSAPRGPGSDSDRCVCMLIRPGERYRPPRSISRTSAPARAARTSAWGPTASIRRSRTQTAASCSGASRVASITEQPCSRTESDIEGTPGGRRADVHGAPTDDDGQGFLVRPLRRIQAEGVLRPNDEVRAGAGREVTEVGLADVVAGVPGVHGEGLTGRQDLVLTEARPVPRPPRDGHEGAVQGRTGVGVGAGREAEAEGRHVRQRHRAGRERTPRLPHLVAVHVAEWRIDRDLDAEPGTVLDVEDVDEERVRDAHLPVPQVRAAVPDVPHRPDDLGDGP